MDTKSANHAELEDANWRKLSQFALQVHRSLDVLETAYTIANEGRAIVACDRLTVLSSGARSARVLAVSGAATADPRSDEVRLLEQLVGAVSAPGSPLLFEGT